MKLLKFLGLFVVILLVSAALTPVIYQYTDFKFDRILSRLVMILTLISLPLFVRVSKEEFADFGLQRKRGWVCMSVAFAGIRGSTDSLATDAQDQQGLVKPVVRRPNQDPRLEWIRLRRGDRRNH